MKPKATEEEEAASRDSSTSSRSAKKLRRSEEFKPPYSDSVGYRILDFLTVFSFLSSVVKCKVCDGEVQFSETSSRGLGFKLRIHCFACGDKYVHSSPLIGGSAYEINRRITFAMRVIGVGYQGLKLFYALMDLPRYVSHTIYNEINNIIHAACKTVAERVMKRAAEEEKEETITAGIFPD